MGTIEYADARYLAAKRTVDDRALNRQVVVRLRAELAASGHAVPRVLDLGAGLGTMVVRLVEWKVIARAEYWLLDVDARILGDAHDRLRAWARLRGYDVGADVQPMRIVGRDGVDLTIHAVAAELGDFLELTPAVPPADLLIANAFLDLVDLPTRLPRILDLALAGGLFWFSINYDGDTIFEPAHPADAMLLDMYNRCMDERVRHGRPAGDSRTGRRLFLRLADAGARVLAAGASDWVVHPQAARYPADEAYFLHHIINTVDVALRARAERAELDRVELDRWVTLRHAQVEAGDLIYLAHQLDFVGRTRAPRESMAFGTRSV